MENEKLFYFWCPNTDEDLEGINLFLGDCELNDVEDRFQDTFSLGMFSTKEAAKSFREELRLLVDKYWLK